MASFSGFQGVRSALSHPHYRRFQFGRFFSQTTTWMYRMTVAWLVWQLTESASWLGIFGFIDHAPALLVSPFAGVLADRYDRMKQLRITQGILLAQAVVLSLCIHFDYVSVAGLACFSLFNAVVNAIQQPATQSIVPNLVPRKDLPTAYGINSLTFNLSRFTGPMVGGFVITTWGTSPAIFGNALGAAIFSLCLATMHEQFTQNIASTKMVRDQNMMRDMRDGVRYLFGHPGLRPLVGIIFFLAFLTFNLIQFLPGFAEGVFKMGAHGLSWMIALIGTGAMIQGAYLAQRGPIAGLASYVIGNIAVVAAALIGLALAENYWLGLVAVFVIGFGNSGNRVGFQTLLQYSVAPHMRGRVASLFGVIWHIGPALGSLAIGALGELFGIRIAFATIGVLALGVFAWATYCKPTMAPALEADGSVDATPPASKAP
jgi:MFS family permease